MWKLAALDVNQGPVQMSICSIIKEDLKFTSPQGIFDDFVWLVHPTVWKEEKDPSFCFPQRLEKNNLFLVVVQDQISL